MPNLKKDFRSVFSRQIGQRSFDKSLLGVVFGILLFGLIVLSSASSVSAYSRYGDAYYFFKHQLMGVSIGLIAFWFFSRFDYHKLRDYAFWFLVGSIILLSLVFIPGLKAGYGTASSWIQPLSFIGIDYSLQPSEFVKISFLLYLAAWLESKKGMLMNIKQGIGPFLVVLSIISLLMILQPDVGTLFIITATSLIVFFVGGGNFKHIFIIVLTGIIVLSALVMTNEYQKNRFRCMADPNFDRQKVCYQNVQSLIAVGSGGILGRGLGSSRQKFFYLPEIQGDSIFAVMAEEMGLLISSALVAAYFYLFYLGYRIARNAPDVYGRILAVGIVSWITTQAFVNIGGIINIMPMTGVPLPLISYGGTSILATLIALGILTNISRQIKS